jgi:hypothetical protein
MEIMGDQLAAKQCLVAAVKQSSAQKDRSVASPGKQSFHPEK